MQLRQIDIEQNHIRPQFCGLLNALPPIRRLDGPEFRPSLKCRTNETAERWMVLDDENPQRHMDVSPLRGYPAFTRSVGASRRLLRTPSPRNACVFARGPVLNATGAAWVREPRHFLRDRSRTAGRGSPRQEILVSQVVEATNGRGGARAPLVSGREPQTPHESGSSSSAVLLPWREHPVPHPAGSSLFVFRVELGAMFDQQPDDAAAAHHRVMESGKPVVSFTASIASDS